MSVIEEVNALILDAREKHATDYFNVVEFLETTGNLLRAACCAGAECDSLGPDPTRKQGEQAYTNATILLTDLGFPGAAEELLIRWWSEVGERQLSEASHIYRAMTAFRLCDLYLKQRDFGAALRWALLTHAEDRLSEHSAGGGAGMQYLRTILGVAKADLDAINRVADENLKTIRTGNQSESGAAWFAEDVLVGLTRMGLSVAHLFSRPSLKPEFPISKPYLETLLGRVVAWDMSTADKGKATDKGKALESLASYLCLLVPGWFPSRNAFDQEAVFENDIVVSNLNPEWNLSGELLGRHFLVECKNCMDPVGVQEIAYFFHRMRLTHCSFGLLLAKKNITGRDEKDNAGHGVIRRLFHEDRNICIVLDREDLAKLQRGETTFWVMLMDEMHRFRFGKPRETVIPSNPQRRKRQRP